MYHYANAVGDGSVLCTTMLMRWVGGSILWTTTVRWWVVVLYCGNTVGGGSVLCTKAVVLYCVPPQ